MLAYGRTRLARNSFKSTLAFGLSFLSANWTRLGTLGRETNPPRSGPLGTGRHFPRMSTKRSLHTVFQRNSLCDSLGHVRRRERWLHEYPKCHGGPAGVTVKDLPPSPTRIACPSQPCSCIVAATPDSAVSGTLRSNLHPRAMRVGRHSGQSTPCTGRPLLTGPHQIARTSVRSPTGPQFSRRRARLGEHRRRELLRGCQGSDVRHGSRPTNV